MDIVKCERLEWARTFVDTCISKHLEAIALTDHHEMVMVPYVRQAIEERVQQSTVSKLWLFPGMELTARGGFQCIMIFDSHIPERLWQQAQGKLGIDISPEHERLAKAPPVKQLQCSYPDIGSELDEIEDLRGRYIVLPNVSQGGNHTVLKQGAHADFLRMPYVGGYLDNGQTMLTLGPTNKRRLSGCDATWSRRSIYPLPTSDNRCETLKDVGSNDTWIKIAEPTAEAIRQAFLSYHSRIRIEQPELPSVVVEELKVEGSTIIDKSELSFSPEFSAIIGGRGSGKSTVLEYLAFGLGRSSYDMPRDHYSGTARMNALIQDFVTSNEGRVSLKVSMDNAVFEIVRGPETEYHAIIAVPNKENRTATASELRKLFPAVVYSQGELADIGRENVKEMRLSDLLQFVDPAFARGDDRLGSEIEEAKARVASCVRSLVNSWTAKAQLHKVTNKRESLEVRAEALERTLPQLSEGDENTMARFEQMRKFGLTWDKATSHMNDVLRWLESANLDLRREREFESEVDGVADSLRTRYVEFYKTFDSGVEKLLSELRAIRGNLAGVESEWKNKQDAVIKKRDLLISTIGRQKVVMDQVGQLREDITGLSSEVGNLEQRLRIAGEPVRLLEAALGRLRDTNRKRDTRTVEWAETIESLSKGRIKASVELGANTDEFSAALDLIATRTGSRETTRESALADALEQGSESDFVDRLCGDCLDLMKWRELGSSRGEQRPECNHLMSVLGKTERIRELVTKQLDVTKVAEMAAAVAKPRISLQYRDGDRYIPFDKASDGQRAAALLFMLLQQATGPLVIDQPEGDLDNRIITELTDSLHEAKRKRQLVFASHNANLVVNGSAELVSYLDVCENGMRHVAFAGAIDNGEIRNVITTNMEGGERAFKDRRDKYGF